MNRKRIVQIIASLGSGLAALSMLINLVVATSRIDIQGPPGSQAFGKSITALPNGNLVVCDPGYDAAGIADAGAMYLYDGATGTRISTLTGSRDGDQVCEDGVTVLPNGNFVIASNHWDNGALADVGAVTWVSGTGGLDGVVSPANSLVGTQAGEHVGLPRRIIDFPVSVIVLPSGNYLVPSFYWNYSAGAVTWGNGATGVAGPISAKNSLVGGTSIDHVGEYLQILANGNYVVLSPSWTNTSFQNAQYAGAVTWGSGTSGVTGQVSAANSLVGSSNSDFIGGSRVTELANGNYVVNSPAWNNGSIENTGAVTWGSGTAGVAGTIGPENSLVGSSTGDSIGYLGVIALANGNYVVNSTHWKNGSGAVTWGNGNTGITGAVNAANSLVGSLPGDYVGGKPSINYSLEIQGVVPLANGNYVVSSPEWDNGAVAGAGAVTWGSGTTGISGQVSAANSLVGSSQNDHVGTTPLPDYIDMDTLGVVALANGNYVVSSPEWNNGVIANAGAVTWADGDTGITGTISVENSLVGDKNEDYIGSYGSVRVLSNGSFLVCSPTWNNGEAANVGAVTWGSGASGVRGSISPANSLVGSMADDNVGSYESLTVLSTGNYLISSPRWDNGPVADAGAVTWGSGAAGVVGPVSPSNSLVGSTPDDQVGFEVTALSNGNYLVSSPYWDNYGAVDAGAVTWGNGDTGITGAVDSANSLVGDSPGNFVGDVIELANGNYLVRSYGINGSALYAGAVTWGNGRIGIAGTVSAANSLVGSHYADNVGLEVTALSNGNYVVASPYWDNGSLEDAGAVTWGNGAAGTTGSVSAANSLVGGHSEDHLGNSYNFIHGVTEVANGNYVVRSVDWDNGTIINAGAVTFGSGTSPILGPISDANSVLGAVPNAGTIISYTYDAHNDQLVVGLPAENKITIFRPNRAPVADAGWSQSVLRGAFVRLDGSASTDPDGNLPLQYTWTQTGGLPVSLSDPHAVSPTFTAPDEKTVLIFDLVVSDALGFFSPPAKVVVFVDPTRSFLPVVPQR